MLRIVTPNIRFLSVATLAVLMSSASPGAAGANDSAYLDISELRERYSRDGDRYVTLADARLRFRDEGEGPVIVLLHGSNSSLEKYDGVVDSLRHRYRLIRFDMPGMGLSEHLDPVNPSATAPGDQLLAMLLDHLGIARAAVVGNSSGGSIGAFFAAHHPDRTQALILANTPSDPIGEARIKHSAQLEEQFAIAAETGMRSMEYWRVYLGWLAGDPDRIAESTVRRYFDMNRRNPAQGGAPPWRLTTAQQEMLEALREVRAPILLLWGMRSLVMPMAAAERLSLHLANASPSRLLLDDVGHYPPLEVPERFALLLAAYLESALPAD